VLELPGGEVTPGEYDLRPVAQRVPMPSSLAGMRCLDVGTRDGFWAFEMERRGAREVVGIDVDETFQLDWPRPLPSLTPDEASFMTRSNRAFATAHAALGSRVERRNLSVYDLSADVVEPFDFAVIGTLLLHLRDPVGALMAIRRVLRPEGRLLVNEVVSLSLSVVRPRSPAAALMTLDAPFWWIPNATALRRYVEAAGFRIEQTTRPYLVPAGPGVARPKLRRRSGWGKLWRQVMLRYGAPHISLLVAPLPDPDG
jgi:tRNA (mo5U34)-methyltransferase